jgi:hypothetical protein
MNYQQFLELLNQLQPNAIIKNSHPTEAYFNALSYSELLATKKKLTGLINLQNGKPYDQD